MIYFTADTHFGHANAVWMCDRPYSDVEVMNEAMIAAWNERVHGNDAMFVYTYLQDKSNFSIQLGMQGECHDTAYCGQDNKKWLLPEGYCFCWHLTEPATVTMKFETTKDKIAELMSQYGNQNTLLNNAAYAYDISYPNDWKQMASDTVNVPLLILRKMEKVAPTEDNDFTATYEVIVNEEKFPLVFEEAEHSDLVIKDTLSLTMLFLPDG